MLQLAVLVAGSQLTLNCQCIGTVAGGRGQTGQGRYDCAVTCGSVVHVGGLGRQMVPVRGATPSKPSHRLLHITQQIKMNVYCKNGRKVDSNCIYGWLMELTYSLTDSSP